MIVHRNQKGSELFASEVDGNFSELDTRTQSGWRDMVCGLEVRDGPSQPPIVQFRDGIYLPSFSPTDMMEGFATAHIDHDWKLGSMLYPHMHWSVNTNSVGVVRWGFEYTWARRFDDTGNISFGPTNTIYVDVETTGVPHTHYVSQPLDGFGIDGGGMNIDTVILIRVFRDVTNPIDTFPDQVFGFTFDLHYEAERATTPNRDPNFFE